MFIKHSTTGNTSTEARPTWRVRRADDPSKWLRSFPSMGLAREFAREHAVAHGCSMFIEKPAEAEIEAWYGGF